MNENYTPTSPTTSKIRASQYLIVSLGMLLSTLMDLTQVTLAEQVGVMDR